MTVDCQADRLAYCCQTNTYENEMTQSSIAMTSIHSRASSCRSSSSEHRPADSITMIFPAIVTSSTQRRRIPVDYWRTPHSLDIASAIGSMLIAQAKWFYTKMPGLHPFSFPSPIIFAILSHAYHLYLLIIRTGTTLTMTARKGVIKRRHSMSFLSNVNLTRQDVHQRAA